MNLSAEFRDSKIIAHVASEIRELAITRKMRIMEVCGGHTAAIYRFALRSLLPENIELLSGPGCPVCVTPGSFIDHAIALGWLRKTVIATFGDLTRVPGSELTLAAARAEGCEVKVFYSSIDALEFAHENPQVTVIFLGIGFETTACTIAATMEQAVSRGIRNFKLLSALKTMPEALRALLTSPEIQVDGLILPGHVSAVTGIAPFEFIAQELKIPCAVSGFEPIDLMESIRAIARQIAASRADVENRYRRAVQTQGNIHAKRAIDKIFRPTTVEWRGLGSIQYSGLCLLPEFSDYDASLIPVALPRTKENPACRCGEVLRGAIHPTECALFGKLCTPHAPVGACMVSSEGACAAVYYFQPDYVA